jgi:putative membrane protein insertion efficiency factor
MAQPDAQADPRGVPSGWGKYSLRARLCRGGQAGIRPASTGHGRCAGRIVVPASPASPGARRGQHQMPKRRESWTRFPFEPARRGLHPRSGGPGRSGRPPDLPGAHKHTETCRMILSFSLLMRHLAALPIRLYRFLPAPLRPPCCRFYPTCSEYALEAVMIHGALRGWLLALRRLLRCSPASRGGFDPVPPPSHRSNFRDTYGQ